MARLPLRRSRAAALLLAVAATTLLAACGSVLRSFVSPLTSQSRRAAHTARAAEAEVKEEAPAPIIWEPVEQKEGFVYGHCLQKDGSWQITENGCIEIGGPEEEAIAQKCWEAFQTQYTGASERGMYLDTPVAEPDVKYRFRKLRDTFGLSTQETLDLIETEALPLVIDSEYVKGTFDAMVEASGREKAIDVVKKNPGVLTAGKGIGENMGMAENAANFIAATRGVNQFLQSVLKR